MCLGDGETQVYKQPQKEVEAKDWELIQLAQVLAAKHVETLNTPISTSLAISTYILKL